jgi:hypothetical protein
MTDLSLLETSAKTACTLERALTYAVSSAPVTLADIVASSTMFRPYAAAAFAFSAACFFIIPSTLSRSFFWA